MQDAYNGNWTEESHLSGEHLNSLRGLNLRFLDLAGTWPNDWGCAGGGMPAAFAEQVGPLSREQRAAAADCPYALFDLRFEDDRHWTGRLQNSCAWRVADELNAENGTNSFVRLALFYAWHLASSAGLTAQLLLGMHRATAQAFRRLALDSLPSLVLTEAANLTPRWSGCGAYWSALIGAAAGQDPAALRRVQLYGLQLSAAARLPNS
jgi:hypothetical protein